MKPLRMSRASILTLCLYLVANLVITGSSQEPREKLGGVCFSSFRDHESPARQIHALPSAVEADVALAAKLARSIRTYTLTGSNYFIPEFCSKYDIDCIVGAWIGPLAWQNDAQLELLTHLLKKDNSSIKAVIVGNEVLHRGDCTESQLIESIRQVKSSTNIPVATADTWRAWTEHPKVAEEVDICGVQIYPYWEGLSIDGAAAYTVQRVLDVKKLYPSKRVILTEFGWPTHGESIGLAHATSENAARYLREVIPLLEQNGIEYYYFAIWDENWKVGPEGSVGAHWGLFYSNGSVKPEFEMLLPRHARKGTDRPPRTMIFSLQSDQSRNEALAEAAWGPKVEIGAQIQAIGQRGVGLEVPAENPSWNPYSGLRPIRLTDSKPASANTAEPSNIERDRNAPLANERSTAIGNSGQLRRQNCSTAGSSIPSSPTKSISSAFRFIRTGGAFRSTRLQPTRWKVSKS